MGVRACAVLCLAAVARAGMNVNVEWQVEEGGATTPLVKDQELVKDHKPKPDARLNNLLNLDTDALTAIVTSFGGTCDTCSTTGHWISKVRHSMLEMNNRVLRSHLTKRGIKCGECTQREHFLDRLIDTVHLPMKG